MRFSIVKFIVCLLLVASLSLNWYLIQQNGLDELKRAVGVNFELPEFFSEHISKPRPEEVFEERILKAEPTHPITVDETLPNLHKLFKANDFDQAWLGLSQSNHEGIAKLKKDWIKAYAKWLNKDPGNPNIDRFIESGLKVYPDDIELRQLEAERLVAQGNHSAAIDQLYALIKGSETTKQKALFSSRIQEISEQHINSLTEQEDWQSLVKFTERLLWHSKDNPSLIFILAQSLTKLERYIEAKNTLYFIANDAKHGAKAKALIDDIDKIVLNKRLDRKAITLSKKHSHHIVTALVDNYFPVNLMIDTGASITSISESMFNSLQQSSTAVFLREQEFNTAGGRVRAPVYRINSFRIDDFEVSNIELAVMDLEMGRAADGLLGMNFLSNFDFKIDQEQNALILAPRK